MQNEGRSARRFTSGRKYFTASEQHRWSYGLPFTRCAPGEGYDAAGPFLSMEVYDGTAATGTKLRSIYVEYESDGINAGGGDDNQEKNHRLTYRKTVYHDDGERFKDMRFSDFDGLGNHRVQTYGGNFSSQDPKTVTVDYNGSLGSAFTLPASSDPSRNKRAARERAASPKSCSTVATTSPTPSTRPIRTSAR